MRIERIKMKAHNRTLLLCLILNLSLLGASTAERARTRLDELGRAQADYLAEQEQASQAHQKRRRIVLGDWHCVGPFKNDAFGGLYESFEHVFAPEGDAMDSGGVPDLKKRYEARKFPGMLDTERPWRRRPEWVDGYRHLLPRGPAPSRFETVYLYRTIDTAEALTVEMSINAEDHIGIWLDGQKGKTAVRAERQPSRYPAQLRTNLSLRRGRNHLLVKITSMWGARGVAFGLKDITPYNSLAPLQWSPRLIRDSKGGRDNFTAGDQPWFAHGRTIGETEPSQPAACTAAMAKELDLPVALIRETLEGATPAEPRALSRQVTVFADALARLGSFRIAPEPIAMFSPARYEIEAYRAEHEAASPNAARYLAELEKTGKAIEAALALQASGEAGGIQAVLQAEKALEHFWDREIEGMAPVVFLKCPRTQLNAVRPYDSRAPTPASICLFDPSRPGDPVRTIFHQADMAIRDLNLSYDAKTIFFSGQSGATGHTWQLFEIGVDGSGLKQITSGRHHNISPCELPDGGLVFVSTRNQLWVTCQGGNSGVLFSCDRDGSHVKLLSANIDSDHTPQVLDDGRVMFTRWDYGVEKNVFARHALWTINPDGSNLALLFGNTIEDPAGFWQARPVPGRSEIVATFGPHHSGQSGMVGVIWPRNGTEQPRGKGFRFITREIPSYCDTTCHYGYQDPFPLHERLFLVSYGGDGGQRNRLYLIDDRGNKKCFYEAEGDLCCYNPQPLVARERPPFLLPQCSNPDWEPMDPVARSRTPPDVPMGTLMVQDVYRGISRRVKRGEAATIQIMEQLRKTTRHLQDAWGTSPLMGRGTVHVRRVIGTVPIEEDGSAAFRVPALRNISLNLLDKDGKILMRMGSDMHVMPGERRGCVGCHEVREGDTTPIASPRIAMSKAPAQPVPPPWGNDGILDYRKLIQPIWDKYCIKCHSGPNPKGMVDMSGDRTRYFCMSYDNLVEREIVDYHNVFALGHDENTPKSLGSYVSRISEFIDTGKHSGKRLSADEKRLIYTWIDANVPYYSTYQFSRPETRGSRDAWAFSKKMFTTFDRNCMGCHERRVYASALYGGWLRVSSNVWRSRGYSAHAITWRWKETPHIGPELRINLTNPSHSPLLQAPLAKDAGGWGLCRKKGTQTPVFADKQDPDYRTMLMEIAVARHKLIDRPRVDISPQDLAELKRTARRDTVAGLIPKLNLPNVKNDTDPSITYGGSWNHHSLQGCFRSDETFTANNGEHAVIAFEGTSISILSRVHPQFGTFKVYVDGKPDADVNTYAAKPADQQRVYTRTGLSDAPHTLKIVKTSGAWIGIDGYEVGSE